MVNEVHKLYVPTMAQKIIFHCEMRGQISDGNWENSRPLDHFEPWMIPWDYIIVTYDDNVYGRNFYPRKCNYNFTDPSLLKVVGNRIMFKVKLWIMFPYAAEKLFSANHWWIPTEYRDIIELNNDNLSLTPWKQNILLAIRNAGLRTQLLLDVYDSNLYTKKDLVKDCEVLKKAFRMFILGGPNGQ